MGDTLNHLEKVIRDVPNGSLAVEPLNHIEKVIQEVGQEVIGMIPSPSAGSELYEHNLYFSDTTYFISCKILSNSQTPFSNKGNVAKFLYDNGFTSYNNPYLASGMFKSYSFDAWTVPTGLYAINATTLSVCGYDTNNSAIGTKGINTLNSDTVIQILGGE